MAGVEETRTRLHRAVLWDHTCMVTMMGLVYSSSKSQDKTLRAGAEHIFAVGLIPVTLNERLSEIVMLVSTVEFSPLPAGASHR
jgi:hypothetical protein